MSIKEKYWLTIMFYFLRYLSILMMGSGVAFILLGYYYNWYFYLALAIWPLLFMWGIVNIKYIRAMTKSNRLEFSKILDQQNKSSLTLTLVVGVF